MILDEAPFFADVADAPGGVHCRWLKTRDGVRIRAALWGVGERGTVFLFPGRTEYVEKYGPAATDLRRRGYAMVTVDWRGQGLADRACTDKMAGHVGDFSEFQADVAALLDFAQTEGMPRPYYLMGHSMGGCIGLRSLHERFPVNAAAFSGPMWGIKIAPALRPFAWLSATLAGPLGHAHRYAPTTSARTYVEVASFADNMLTRDPEMFDFMRRQAKAHPELTLGGPTLGWLHAALRECRALRHMRSPGYPCYTALGSVERIVDIPAIHDRMSRWPGGRLDLIEGAEHEVIMETPERRGRFFDEAAALFAANP